jgi:anthranilate synthase component 1
MMAYLPDPDAFLALAGAADLVPICRRLLGDSLTPVSAFSKLDTGGSACLFESVIGGEKVGRYSFLATEPFLEFQAEGHQVQVVGPQGREMLEAADPLEELRRRLGALRTVKVAGLPPFTGGAVGYAGYDTVRYCERLPSAPPDELRLPDLAFAFYDHLLVFDHVSKTLWVMAMARIDRSRREPTRADLMSAYQDACRRVDTLVERLERPADLPRLVDIDDGTAARLAYTSNFTPIQFQDAVRRCVEYIRAGDIFQVVISQRLRLGVQSSPLEIYRTLRVVNPSPFMFFLRTPRATLIGSSPEVMVRVMDGEITVRPLAGTRPRGGSDDEDRRLAEELLADPKERAEHVMLVDLGRNDVGRVARYGSVRLTDVMTIERYSHVMHITSNVTGQLQSGRDAFDALRACLPAGTVSGAPKVRAMEIIDELEPSRRGPYAGAVGYIDFGGNMDTCIALRTIVMVDSTAYIQAGAGIVADSVPEREYQETLNKARGLLKALEITEHRAAAARSRADTL